MSAGMDVGRPHADRSAVEPAYLLNGDIGYNGGGTTTSGDPEAMMTNYENVFGPAAREIKWDAQRHKRHQRWHLPDALKGSNTFLTDRIDGLITDATSSPFTKHILPYLYTENPDQKIKWNVYSFDEGLASRVPYESAARVLPQSKRSFAGYAVRHGLAIAMEHNFMMSPQGMENFRRQLMQLVGSIQLTNDLDVHMALLYAPSYQKHMDEKYWDGSKTLTQMCRMYVDLFGFVQKNENALDYLIEDAKNHLSQWGSKPPTFMLTNGALTRQLTMTPERTNYITAGPDGKKRLAQGPDLPSYRGLSIINTRQFSLESGSAPRDMLRRRVRVSEHFRIPWERTNYKKRFEFYDQSRDSMFYLSWDDLWRASFPSTAEGAEHFVTQEMRPKHGFSKTELALLNLLGMWEPEVEAVEDAKMDALVQLTEFQAYQKALDQGESSGIETAMTQLETSIQRLQRKKQSSTSGHGGAEEEEEEEPNIEHRDLKEKEHDKEHRDLNMEVHEEEEEEPDKENRDLNFSLFCDAFDIIKADFTVTMRYKKKSNTQKLLYSTFAKMFLAWKFPFLGRQQPSTNHVILLLMATSGNNFMKVGEQADILKMINMVQVTLQCDLFLLRPNIEHYMLGVVMGRGGGPEELGATFWGQTELSCYDDSQHGIWGMSYKYHERAIVINERNLIRVFDVCFDGYCGGNDSRILQWNAEECEEFANATQNLSTAFSGPSIIAMALPPYKNVYSGFPNPIVWHVDMPDPSRIKANPDRGGTPKNIEAHCPFAPSNPSATPSPMQTVYKMYYTALGLRKWNQLSQQLDPGHLSYSNETDPYIFSFHGHMTTIQDGHREEVHGSGHLGSNFVGVASVREGRGMLPRGKPMLAHLV